MFETLGIGWWAARARLMAGLVGQGDEAAVDLRAARAAFDAMGAEGWRERVEESFAAAVTESWESPAGPGSPHRTKTGPGERLGCYSFLAVKG